MKEIHDHLGICSIPAGGPYEFFSIFLIFNFNMCLISNLRLGHINCLVYRNYPTLSEE